MMSWIASDERFLAASVPTGFGKSLLAMLTSHFSGMRTVYMTSTKGLQTQLMADFNRLGLVDIRGQNEYQCIQFPQTRVDEAPCKAGYDCPVRSTCDYYSQLDRASTSNKVVTNYAYWLAQNEYGSGISQSVQLGETTTTVNPPRLLILDEAHMASRALESFLTVEFTDYDRVDLDWKEDWNYEAWRRETQTVLPGIEQEMERIRQDTQRDVDRPGNLVRRYQHLKGMQMRCKRMGMALDWVQEARENSEGMHSMVWTPLWTKDYNDILFRDVPKILLMSAILTPMMVEKLGVEARWLESGSPFPKQNTPITHVNTVRVDHRATDEQMVAWADRVDDIIRQRQHQKGIIFTVSYNRAKFLKERSRYSHQMFTHHTRNVTQVVEKFKKAPAPAVLVSPSVTTGYDFPQEQCEYIIVGKIPYPDTRAAIIKARVKEDRDWAAMLAMEVLVQETGRGTRSADDKCQVLVIDDSWRWWWPKYKEFAPKWFQDRVTRSVDRIPTPI